MTEAMPFLQKHDITFLRPPPIERGIIFGADGGGRTRTVLLPTDFESVTSANSITSAY